MVTFNLNDQRHFLVSGATGFIGSALCHALLKADQQVTVLTRNPARALRQFNNKVNALATAELAESDIQADVIINLAGAQVIGLPWTKGRRRILLESRLQTTEALLAYVSKPDIKPDLWIQASAIGYYGADPALEADESTPAGQGFAADLCQQWETEASKPENCSTRSAILRFGVIAGRNGGALPMMLLPYRFALGAVIGSGLQHFAWMHIDDLLRVFEKVISDDNMQGVYNAVAPHAPTYRELSTTIGEIMHRPVFLRMPAWLMHTFLGEMATMLTGGPVVLPDRLQQAGFEYRYPELELALSDIIRN